MNDTYSEKYLQAMLRFGNINIQNPITHEAVKACFLKRAPESHKGTCGNLFICAGSKGLTGAAIMATESALRCGCGLVTLGCSESLNEIFEIRLTEAMTFPLKDTNGIICGESADKIIEKANRSDAFLFGPGLSDSTDIIKIIEKISKNCTVPVIIDADGINALSHNINVLKNFKCPVVLTPHPGEFSRLTGLEIPVILKNTQKYACAFAKEYGVNLVLKSHRTVVCSSNGEVFTNILGNPGMACGGTGDVLAGAIASFTAQGKGVFASCLAGVYIHSLAADMASIETGEYSLLPRDIIEYIKYAVRETSLRA